MRLTQAAQARRADLEKSAFEQTLGYQQKKVQDMYIEQQGKMEQEYRDEQAHLSAEIQRIREQHGPAPPLLDPNPLPVAAPGLLPYGTSSPGMPCQQLSALPPGADFKISPSPMMPHPSLFSPAQLQQHPASASAGPMHQNQQQQQQSGSVLIGQGSVLSGQGSMLGRPMHPALQQQQQQPALQQQRKHGSPVQDARLLNQTELLRELDSRCPEDTDS